jgi:hypothetical protein
MAWREIHGDRLELGPGLERALLPAATTVTNLLLRFLDPEQGGSRSTDATRATCGRPTCARYSHWRARTRTSSKRRSSIRENLLVARPEAT